jgi:hypothetical protein
VHGASLTPEDGSESFEFRRGDQRVGGHGEQKELRTGGNRGAGLFQ